MYSALPAARDAERALVYSPPLRNQRFPRRDSTMDELGQFLMTQLPLTVAAALLGVALVVVELKRAFRPWREVGPFELTQLVNAGAPMLDLRDAARHRAGHIAGARSVALAEVEAALKGATRDAPVVLYSESGTDCGTAAARLCAAGYTQVATLRGGLASWRTENLPLARA